MESAHYEELDIESKDLSLDGEIIRLEQVEWVAKELEKINQSYADILTLKYYYEYSNLEISKLLNITEGNVRVRLHRARQSIKKILLESVDYGQI